MVAVSMPSAAGQSCLKQFPEGRGQAGVILAGNDEKSRRKAAHDAGSARKLDRIAVLAPVW